MKPTAAFFALALAFTGAHAATEGTFDEAMAKEALQYAERLRQAGQELDATRAKMAREEAPVLEKMRRAEDRALAAEQDDLRLQSVADRSLETRRRLEREAELLFKNANYIVSLADEGLRSFGDGLAPGAAPAASEPMHAIRRRLTAATESGRVDGAVEAADFLLRRVQAAVGGTTAAGRSLAGDGNQVVDGVFAFSGPDTYFRSDDGDLAGIVLRSPEGGDYPAVYPLAGWTPEMAASFFQGKDSAIPADASGGKAFRLDETKGNLFEHVRKGGVVAFAIVAMGVLALVLIIQKCIDGARIAVDGPDAVNRFLRLVATAQEDEARRALGSLKPTTRKLFAAGLECRDLPKIELEERLQAELLDLRMHYERRLPLLTVIATAAPLMGLLGTVIGMVQTFALITVFGTGNAGKLASGISEVLVSTELGLVVAVPTLVAHGFLAHRIQKNLSRLERYALEFVTASRAHSRVISEAAAAK